MIGLFVRPQTQRERNVVRFSAAVCGEEGALRDDTKNGCVANYTPQEAIRYLLVTIFAKIFYSSKSVYIIHEGYSQNTGQLIRFVFLVSKAVYLKCQFICFI